MLTHKEKKCAIELLNALDFSDLLVLAKTSTNGNWTPKNKEEAIYFITQYEESVWTLLNRKKVTKVLLINYLHFKKIKFSVNADKITLVDIVVKTWESWNSESCVDDSLSYNKPIDHKDNNDFQHSSNLSAEAGETQVQKLNSEKKIENVDPTLPQIEVMALKFSEWFYLMMNEYFTKKGGPRLKTDDFWSDCTASIKIFTSNEEISHSANTSIDTLAMFESAQVEHNLFFQPNLLPEGIKGCLHSYGTVLVLACGTLHKGVGVCVGVFEQIFALIKDPLSCDNWKIKATELRLKTQSNVSGPPKLEQCDLFNQLVPLN